MNEPVIQVSGLGKAFSIYSGHGPNKSLSDTIADVLASPLKTLKRIGSLTSPREKIWALRNINFDVQEGEVVGIVGRNGAGKSTLLKILSRITEPTEGQAIIRGKLGALLEVGVGFHPDLTGRENVYLNGVILGMRKAKVDRLFEEIVNFAEIEKFIDTPMKHYSSGMYVRLAFAVAAHLDSEILVIDEVLAVGDASFQNKCLGKISDVARQGRTVLFVSHNTPTVMALCTRAILLDKGEVIADGAPKVVLNQYLSTVENAAETQLVDRTDRKGNQCLKFTKVELINGSGQRVPCVYSGEDVTLGIDYRSTNRECLKDVHVEIEIYGRFHESILQMSPTLKGMHFQELPPDGTILLTIPHLPLQPGRYPLDIYSTVTGTMADYVQNAAVIAVEGGDYFGSGKLPEHGRFLADHSWRVKSTGQAVITYAAGKPQAVG